MTRLTTLLIPYRDSSAKRPAVGPDLDATLHNMKLTATRGRRSGLAPLLFSLCLLAVGASALPAQAAAPATVAGYRAQLNASCRAYTRRMLPCGGG